MNYFIAKGQKNGKDVLVRFDKSQFDKEKATELLNNNEVRNFFFFFEPAPPTEIDENTMLFSGEVGFDITLDILLPYIKANKTIALNSVGGYNSDAMLIHDLVKDFYPETKMLIMGNCFSATNQIFLSAKYENREATQHSKFLIHNGWVYMEGDHNQLRTVANMLEKETNTMIDLYVKVSNKPREEIVNLMEAEKMLNTSDALDLNFISKIKNNEVAEPQIINKNQDNKMTENQTKEAKVLSFVEKLGKDFFNFFKEDSPNVKNILLQDVNGVELDFNVEEESQITEGTSVTANGEPANGTHPLPSGTTIEAANGIVTSVVMPEVVEDTQIQELTAEVENLKNQLTEKNEEIKTLNSEKSEIESKLETVKNDFTKKLNDFKNQFTEEKPEANKPAEGQNEKGNKKPSINMNKVREGVTFN